MFATKALVKSQQIATTATSYYSAPEGTYTRITQITVTNQDSAARTFSLYLVKTGDSPVANNRVVYDKTLQAGESYVPYQVLGAVLEPGGQLFAVASTATQLTLYASGIELTF